VVSNLDEAKEKIHRKIKMMIHRNLTIRWRWRHSTALNNW